MKHPPCPYEGHRNSVWRKVGGVGTCTVCHPMPWPLVCRVEDRAQGFYDEGRFVGVEWVDPSELVSTVAAPRPEDASVRTSAITKDQARALFERWRSLDDGWVRARIVTLARIHGAYHAEMLRGVTLPNRSAASTAVNALASGGLVVKQGSDGLRYIWGLTPKGRTLAAFLRKELGGTDRLPGPRRADDMQGTVSKDGAFVQGALVEGTHAAPASALLQGV